MIGALAIATIGMATLSETVKQAVGRGPSSLAGALEDVQVMIEERDVWGLTQLALDGFVLRTHGAYTWEPQNTGLEIGLKSYGNYLAYIGVEHELRDPRDSDLVHTYQKKTTSMHHHAGVPALRDTTEDIQTKWGRGLDESYDMTEEQRKALVATVYYAIRQWLWWLNEIYPSVLAKHRFDQIYDSISREDKTYLIRFLNFLGLSSSDDQLGYQLQQSPELLRAIEFYVAEPETAFQRAIASLFDPSVPGVEL